MITPVLPTYARAKVAFERGEAVVGDEVRELVEVGLEPGAGWHQGDGGEGGGAHVDSVRHQG